LFRASFSSEHPGEPLGQHRGVQLIGSEKLGVFLSRSAFRHFLGSAATYCQNEKRDALFLVRQLRDPLCTLLFTGQLGSDHSEPPPGSADDEEEEEEEEEEDEQEEGDEASSLKQKRRGRSSAGTTPRAMHTRKSPRHSLHATAESQAISATPSPAPATAAAATPASPAAAESASRQSSLKRKKAPSPERRRLRRKGAASAASHERGGTLTSPLTVSSTGDEQPLPSQLSPASKRIAAQRTKRAAPVSDEDEDEEAKQAVEFDQRPGYTPPDDEDMLPAPPAAAEREPGASEPAMPAAQLLAPAASQPLPQRQQDEQRQQAQQPQQQQQPEPQQQPMQQQLPVGAPAMVAPIAQAAPVPMFAAAPAVPLAAAPALHPVAAAASIAAAPVSPPWPIVAAGGSPSMAVPSVQPGYALFPLDEQSSEQEVQNLDQYISVRENQLEREWQQVRLWKSQLVQLLIRKSRAAANR
jgi:hypothetical protein